MVAVSSSANALLRGPTIPLRDNPSHLFLRSHRVRFATVCASIAVAVTSSPASSSSVVDTLVNAIRFLAIDVVEKANSVHPGLPMGSAMLGHILFDEIMSYNPQNPYWFNRDRFVLSVGYGCALHYTPLYLAGYDGVNVWFDWSLFC